MMVFLFFLLLLLPVQSWAKTLTYTTAASNDDCYANSGGYEPLTWVGVGTTPTDGFLRWGVRIPKNATITSAYLNLTGYNNQAGSTEILMKLLDEDDCAAFTSNPWSRSVTGSVSWTRDSITEHVQYQSADISTLVDSYIDRGGYNYGQYLGLRLVYSSGVGKRFESYDSGTTGQKPELVVNYTGGDGIVMLWMADPHVRTKQRVYAQIWNQDEGDKIKFYLDDNLKYTYTIQAGDVPGDAATRFEVSYLFDYTALTAGSHHIDVEITTSGDSQRGIATTTWTTLHDYDDNGVWINENNSLCIGTVASCTLFLPMPSWQFGADNGSSILQYGTHPFKDVINSTANLGYSTDGYNLGSHGRYLDANVTYGWRSMFPGRWYCNGVDYSPSSTCTLGSAAAQNYGTENNSDCDTPESAADCATARVYKNHAGLLAWMWGDEWNLYNVSTALFITWKTNTRAVDTTHPIAMSYYGYDFNSTKDTSDPPAKYTYLRGNFTTHVDWMTADYYPYEFGGMSPGGKIVNLENNMAAIDRLYAWNYGLFPMGWFVEPHSEESEELEGECVYFDPPRPDLGDPTVPQVLNMFYLYLIHGSRTSPYFAPDVPGDCDAETPSQTISDLVTNKGFLEANSQAMINMILSADSAKMTRETFNVPAAQGIGTVTVNLPWSAATDVSNSGRVDYTVREYGGKVYVIAARVYQVYPTEDPGWPNKGNSSAVSATFNLSGLSGTYYATRKIGSGSLTVTDGVFTEPSDSGILTQYGYEIYELDEQSEYGHVSFGSGVSIGTGIKTTTD